ncbi:tyrosine-type recombinase/integrase [Actinomadura litoris]|uniref:Tyrosine-type recombinase/integrase n=1 Tax=Actinomadura litoris TaxID=2678616 RepID=A0A7K1L3H9_9ACTN|nr:tyrosine-type recombinase/integrase [Actinomadura litoris]MUN38981.1 tyrosine-type recombinase/integrase [Actinomadura litoris]
MADDTIKTVVLKNGKKRYRFVIDIGPDPKTGRRRQKTYTFDKRTEAKNERDRIRNQRAQGTFVAPSKVTVNEIIDSYLAVATLEARRNTKTNYQHSFRCVRERLGDMPAQGVTVAHIVALVKYMQSSGRKRGGKPGTGLSGRSVNLTLGRLRAAFELGVQEGRLARNVAALVKNVSYQQPERKTWTKGEVHTFLKAIDKTRLEVAWRLSLYGLRRGEVLGLRREDVRLKARKLKVVQTRVMCDSEVIIEPPKSRNGERELPIDDELAAALERLYKLQSAEAEKAGAAYQDGLAELEWYEGGQYLVTDELGIPVHPEWYSDEFGRVLKRAGLRRITLHDSRHTTLSLMEKAGVPISVISKWAGHFDSAFTQNTYVHANPEDLAAGGEALAMLHKIS